MGSPRGKLLGRYEIVAEVGRGAMGSVYKARDPKIDRFVAIKTVLLHQSAVQEQQEFRRRFFVEAQAAGRLLHPGIVAVFDVGEDPETSDPYIVMEFIEGLTLRELLARNNKKLPVEDALRIVQELAEALDYAHAQGVVHRDIKPANVLITKDGQAKISDFGIAQLDLTHMTLPGRVLGTPAYMSPEQLEGAQVDGRSDLFSLGAILYTTVTGYRPFQGNSATTVCYQVANREPLEATSLAPELPQELDAVIARALNKNPAERYQRGMQFAEDLRKLRERRPARKNTLWFSPPVAGRTFLDGKSGVQASSSAIVAAKKAIAPQRPASRKDRSFGAMLSTWQVQTAIGVPLLAAAMVVSLFAWREIHEQRRGSGNRVQNLDRAGSPETGQQQSGATGVAAGGADSHSQVPVGVRAGVQAPHSEIDSATEIRNEPVEAAVPTRKGPVLASKSSAPDGPRKSARARVVKADAGTASKLVTPAVSETDGTVAPPATTAAIPDSNVQIRIDNRFSDATLKVWIDDTLAYAHPLHDGRKKRLMLLGGGAKDTVTIPISSGKHSLRVEVRSASEQYDETKTIPGEFLTGGDAILSINFEKHTREMRVTLGNE